ncbi:VENN motif pre-toxin domain-containing protein [Pantoea sp. CCBC3-3-1]|uniref:VENN motif pre-toxin domain-containing protein n=1 Tax=Pantoea sp. CCBC3-3-1 TaxID=2490851 RepID=UPI00352B39E2
MAGNVQGAIAGAAAPYLAELIHRETITTGPDGKEVVNEPANLIAHAVLGAVVAQIQNNSALAGATGATAGEFIAQQLYPGVDRDKLSEGQKQIVSELGTLAAGLAGGIAGDSTASAVAGAQAGKNAVENNNLAVLGQGVRLVAQGCTKVAACRNALIEKGLGSLLGISTAVTVLDKLSDTDKEYVLGVAATGRADLIEKLTPEQREAYNYMVAQDQKGLVTIFPQPDRDVTGGRLISPAQDENKGTSLVTPDRSGSNSSIITISPETQPGKNDGIFINPKPVENTGSSYISESSGKSSAGDFFTGTTYTDKVKQQASSGDFHSFPESVDGHANQGTVSVITGGDGVERLRLEISGSYRGKEGIFEYIREPNGSINHRLFVPKK